MKIKFIRTFTAEIDTDVLKDYYIFEEAEEPEKLSDKELADFFDGLTDMEFEYNSSVINYTIKVERI